jgi:hypothetical protein
LENTSSPNSFKIPHPPTPSPEGEGEDRYQKGIQKFKPPISPLLLQEKGLGDEVFSGRRGWGMRYFQGEGAGG